jgi:hypothetical protein
MTTTTKNKIKIITKSDHNKQSLFQYLSECFTFLKRLIKIIGLC